MASEKIAEEPPFEGMAKKHTQKYVETCKVVRGLTYKKQIWTDVRENIYGKTWKREETVRSLRDNSLWYKVVDIYIDGQNVYHHDSSTLESAEIDQFKKLWIKNFDRQSQSTKGFYVI